MPFCRKIPATFSADANCLVQAFNGTSYTCEPRPSRMRRSFTKSFVTANMPDVMPQFTSSGNSMPNRPVAANSLNSLSFPARAQT